MPRHRSHPADLLSAPLLQLFAAVCKRQEPVGVQSLRPTCQVLLIQAMGQRIDGLFDIDRGINSKPAADGLAIRQELSASLMAELHAWLTSQLARLSRNHDLGKAINYKLRRWDAFTRFHDDGRICLTNNTAESALRCVPLGRKAWLFCGSDRGGQRAAVLYTQIQAARLNDVDPQAWLADVLGRIADCPVSKLGDLLRWNWRTSKV